MDNGRQQRGLEIAARFRVRRIIGGWLVPSQSGPGKYTVVMGQTPTCTCPDFETRGVEIHGRDAADSPQLPALVQATAETFAIGEVSADKGYSGRRNADVIANVGTDAAMINETLAKILRLNLVALIHEMHDLGIDPSFWAGPTGAQHILASA